MTPPNKQPLVPALRTLLEEEAHSEHPTPERLIDYQSGWLTAEERGQIEAHLRTCQECRELLADLAAFVAGRDLRSGSATADAPGLVSATRSGPARCGNRQGRSKRLAASATAVRLRFGGNACVRGRRFDILGTRLEKPSESAPGAGDGSHSS
jgi:anti-sigma factor RsiW